MKHTLSPSVKAGGYGTAGWAIGGDVIIDMSKLTGVDIEPPTSEGSYTSLRNMAAPGSKGKGKVKSSTANASTSGKRRREEDNELRSYDSASSAVASFLQAPGLPSEPPDFPPSNRRRLDPDSSAVSVTPQALISRNNPSTSESVSAENASVASASVNSPKKSTTDSLSSLSGADPFGYMDADSSVYQPSPSSTHFLHRSFGPSTSALFTSAGMVAPTGNLLAWASPIHQHAYVTFGAGMRQKEIDIYTAENPLEAASLSASKSYVPYHVPLSVCPLPGRGKHIEPCLSAQRIRWDQQAC